MLQYNLHIRQLKPHRISTAELSVAQHRVTNSAPFFLKQTLHGVFPHLVVIKPSKLEFLLLKNKIWNPRLLMKQNIRWSTRYRYEKEQRNLIPLSNSATFSEIINYHFFTIVQILAKGFTTESIRKLSNFNFQWTKTLYQNIFRPYRILFQPRPQGAFPFEVDSFLHFLRAINVINYVK